MSLKVRPLTKGFCAEIGGVDFNAPLNRSVVTDLRDAFDTYSVLVIRDQPMDDNQQVVFSQYFGRPEVGKGANPAAGSPFSRQSNLDIKTGEIIRADDRRMLYQKGNMLWHMDSSFKAHSSLCSILTARVVPPEGGDTEFASTRFAYESLSKEQRSAIEGLEVEHDIRRSRKLTGYVYEPETAKNFIVARHKLVRTNPGTGRKSLLIGVHACNIVGWSDEKSRELLDDFLVRAEQCVFSHQWRNNDIVIWDNQAVVHRATPYDADRYRRLMQRTTISLDGTWPSLS